jgi:FkbM family methyltransferase
MKVNRKSVLGILVRIAAFLGRSRLLRILHGQELWNLATRNILIRNIPFSFNAEVNGIRFRLRGPFRYAGSSYYITYLRHGAWEAAVTAHITRVVRKCPAPKILDVGAHYGWYTIYLAKLADNKGVVYAFEPSETIFAHLKRNVESNNLRNVNLYKLPLSDKQEAVNMVFSKRFPQEARVMSVIEDSTSGIDVEMLNAITFDELNETEAIYPNIVKIDVRSVWRKVIDGMRKTLYRDVQHLYLELDTTTKDLSSQYANIKHVISILHDAGMDVYEIEDFDKRAGGTMITANEDRIANLNCVMLYGVKKEPS